MFRTCLLACPVILRNEQQCSAAGNCLDMAGCQNEGPFSGPYTHRATGIYGAQKRVAHVVTSTIRAPCLGVPGASILGCRGDSYVENAVWDSGPYSPP